MLIVHSAAMHINGELMQRERDQGHILNSWIQQSTGKEHHENHSGFLTRLLKSVLRRNGIHLILQTSFVFYSVRFNKMSDIDNKFH